MTVQEVFNSPAVKSVEIEILDVIQEEENTRKKLYSTSEVKKEGSKVESSYCCYGVELI